MALIIALGSNMGDASANLRAARDLLAQRWRLIAESRVYRSKAVDYEAQPDFLNQVLQFALPWESPDAVMRGILEIEIALGRERLIPKGPRIIDIDMLFWGLTPYRGPELTVPHPRWRERSFVVRPLSELPFFHAVEKCFIIPRSFDVEAYPVDA